MLLSSAAPGARPTSRQQTVSSLVLRQELSGSRLLADSCESQVTRTDILSHTSKKTIMNRPNIMSVQLVLKIRITALFVVKDFVKVGFRVTCSLM